MIKYTRPFTCSILAMGKNLSQSLEEIPQSPIYWNANAMGWLHYGERTQTEKTTSVFEDKLQSISDLSLMKDSGLISLSPKVVVVAEGCDNGNYFPLLKGMLFPQNDQESVIFSTDISLAMSKRGANEAVRAFGSSSKVFYGRSSAFQGPPSGLGKFLGKQMLFLPFRMGILGCHEELTNYMLQRAGFMSYENGIMVMHFLDYNESNSISIIKEATRGKESSPDGQRFSREVSVYSTEILQKYTPPLLQKHAAQFKTAPEGTSKQLSYSLRANNYVTMVSMFQLEQVVKLINNAGFALLNPQSFEKLSSTKTDSGYPITVRTAILHSKQESGK